MPKVPTYDSFQVSPGVGGLGEAQAPSAELASLPARQMQEQGRAMLGAGNRLFSVAEDIQKDVNEGLVKQADVELANALRDLQHNPERGYLNTLGETAVKGREDTLKAIDKLKTSFSSRFTNDAQRAMWDTVSTQRTQQALMQVDVHASKQAKVFSAGQSEARAKAQIPDMVVSWNDPQKFAQAKATMLAEVDSLAGLQGVGEDQKKLMRQGMLTGAHSEVLNNIMSLNRSQDARLYFERHKDEIDPTKWDAIRNSLEAVSIKGDSLDLSMQLAGRGGISALKDMYKAGTISAEVFDATRTRLEHEDARAKAGQGENDRAMSGRAQEWLMQNPGKSVLDLPANLYAWARNRGQLAGLSNVAKSVAADAGIGGKVETDWVEYEKLRDQARNDPEAFMQMNLREFPLGKQQLETLLDIKDKIGKPEKAKEFTSLDDQLNKAYADLELLGSTNAKSRYALEYAVRRELDIQSGGKPLSIGERQKIIDRAILEGKAEGDWSSSRAYQHYGKPSATTFKANVTSEMRKEAEQSFRALGMQPSDDDISKWVEKRYGIKGQ